MSDKRKADDNDSDNEDGWTGPLPSDAAPKKKKRG